MNAIEKQTMYNAIEKHGNQLNAIFNTKFDAITLCKKLHRLEKKAHHATTCLCNTNTLHLMELNRSTGYDVEQATEEQQDVFFTTITKAVCEILGDKAKDAVFINFDPRGYALKMKSEFCKGFPIYTDWGGFGIVAPDFTPNK